MNLYRGCPLYTIVFHSVTLVYKRFSTEGRFLLQIGPEFCETVIFVCILLFFSINLFLGQTVRLRDCVHWADR